MREIAEPKTQMQLLDWFRHAPAPMPRNQAELFRCLAAYNPRAGWDAFVENIDFTNITSHQIYQAVLGPQAGKADHAAGPIGQGSARHFREALVSRAFREHCLSAFLQAYSSKGRDVFIHVPKCAGTDLILNLGCRSIPLPKMLEIEGWIDDFEFIEVIAGLARAAMADERLFVYGHMELGHYIDIAGVRPDDRIFTVLRNPVDQMVSQANYAIGRLRQDPTGREPDAAEYLRLLGLTRLPDQISVAELKDLTFKALRDPLIAEPNRACFYLGRNFTTAFATALDNLIKYNVEITTTENYDRWLNERWGITSSSHHNSSEPIFSDIEARRICGSALAAASAEDQKLFDVVSWALRRAGTASITGQQLAWLFGPKLSEVLQTNQSPLSKADRQRSEPDQNILVAHSSGHVEMYLAPVSLATAEACKPEPVITAAFGHDDDSQRYRLQGWASSERDFTWTNATHSTIQLPTLTGLGTFLVRLIASPFIVPQKRPFQQVEVLIDGVRLGACRVKDISVIEVEVPAEMLVADNRLILALNLPNAAHPCELTDSKDDRLLALAVRSMAIFRIPPVAETADALTSA